MVVDNAYFRTAVQVSRNGFTAPPQDTPAIRPATCAKTHTCNSGGTLGVICSPPTMWRTLVIVFTSAAESVAYVLVGAPTRRTPGTPDGEPAICAHRLTFHSFGAAIVPGARLNDASRSQPCPSGLTSRTTVAALASTASAPACRPVPAARSCPSDARRAARSSPRNTQCYPVRTNSLPPPTSKRR